MNKILQCGFPKSGNYFLWNLLRSCQKKTGVFSSFIIRSGIHKFLRISLKKVGLDYFLFKENFELDDIAIEEFIGGGSKIKNSKATLYLNQVYRVSKVKFEVDKELLLYASSLIWTHSLPILVIKTFTEISIKKFYVIRDGRDVVNSLIHQNCRDDIRRLTPEYKISDPYVLYSKLNIFESYVRRWNDHIREFFKVKKFFIPIRYEKLVSFGEDFMLILKLFNLSDEENIEYFKKTMSFDNMKKENKGHLRKGKHGDWKNYFSEVHKKIFKEIAGETLIKLGYEKDMNW